MVMTALLAIGAVLGFVAVRTVAHTSPGSSASAPTTTTSAPPTASGSRPVPAAPPSTTLPPKPAPSPAPVTTAAPAQLTACTPSDVTVTTTTAYSSYPANSYVQVTTVVRDVFPCSFVPESVSGACPSAISVVDGSGGQVWPAPGQGEQCSLPATRTLSPGDVETLQAEWNQQVKTTSGQYTQAPPGSYVALGSWSWQQSGGSPYQVQVRSAPFTIG